jgi:hypothetical protein
MKNLQSNNPGTDRTENTSPTIISIASRSYSIDRVESTASQLLHCCMLRICNNGRVSGAVS